MSTFLFYFLEVYKFWQLLWRSSYPVVRGINDKYKMTTFQFFLNFMNLNYSVYYHPKRKLWERNVFTGVCLSTGGSAFPQCIEADSSPPLIVRTPYRQTRPPLIRSIARLGYAYNFRNSGNHSISMTGSHFRWQKGLLGNYLNYFVLMCRLRSLFVK